ncbi:MAG: metallophosphoesterase family protein [Pirellulales bacterium]
MAKRQRRRLRGRLGAGYLGISSRSDRSTRHRYRPSLETLEPRRMLAAGLGEAATDEAVAPPIAANLATPQYTVNHAPRLQLGNAPLPGFAGSTTDQVDILWQTMSAGTGNEDTFVVEYRAVGAPTWTSANSINAPIVTGFQGRLVHSATILGLQYDSAYEYRVQHLRGGMLVEEWQAEFRTRLAAGSNDSFTFAAYGDSAGLSTLGNFRDLQAQINAYDPDFGLLLGDNVYNSGAHDESDARFDPDISPEAAEWIAGHIDYYSVGNHDIITAGGKPSRDNFSMPIPQAGVNAHASLPSGEQPEHVFSWDYGNVHFVTFDSNVADDGNGSGALARLTRQLDYVVADLNASNATWKVVYFHHPMLGTEKPQDPGDIFFQQVFGRIHNDTDADILMTGHSHIYGWTYPMTGFNDDDGDNTVEQHEVQFIEDTDRNYQKGNGLVQLVSGVGGRSLRLHAFDEPYTAQGYSRDGSTPPVSDGFTLVEVTPTSLTLSYIDADSGQIVGDFNDNGIGDADEPYFGQFTITSGVTQEQPEAQLASPEDNGEDDFDPDPGEVLADPVPSIQIQLVDFNGEINDATVTASALSLSRDGSPLVEGSDSDYHFSYDVTTDLITLSPVGGGDFAEGVYTIGINQGAAKIADDEAIAIDPTTFVVHLSTDFFVAGANVVLTGTAVETFVPEGGTWKYLDNGSDQGGLDTFSNTDSSWFASTLYNDTASGPAGAWKTGTAQFGYGEGDEATGIQFGPDPTNRPATTYFRYTFLNTSPVSAVSEMVLSLLRDDGAAVYLNGVEIRRDNLPAGAAYDTFATASVGGSDESMLFPSTIVGAGPLRLGTNVLAVELHNVTPANNDLSFDLALTAEVLSFEGAQLRVDFSDSINTGTVQADDLVINGSLTALGRTIVDNNTVLFDLPTLSEGFHQASIAAGAILSASGDPLESYEDDFLLGSEFDVAPPTVELISPEDDGPKDSDPGFDSLTVRPQSEIRIHLIDARSGIDDTSVSSDSVVLVRDGAILTPGVDYDFNYDDAADQIVLTPLGGEFAFELGDYDLQISHGPSGVVSDLEGNELSPRTISMLIKAPFPMPLTPLSPAGGLIYEGSALGELQTADHRELFTLPLTTGETISLVAVGLPGMQPTIEVLSPSQSVVATATASAPGGNALLQTFLVSGSGTYTIRISDAGGATGDYSLSLLLNAANEAESHGGPANGSTVSAQLLTSAFINLPGGAGAQRAAVAGNSQPGDTDLYRFTIGADERVSVALAALDGSSGNVSFELLNSGGTTVATGSSAADLEQILHDFGGPAGNYYLQVIASAPVSYSLVVARNSGFEAETNDSLAQAQPIGPTHTVLGAVADPADIDFYSVAVGEGDTLELLFSAMRNGPPQPINTLSRNAALYGPGDGLITDNFFGTMGGIAEDLAAGTYKLAVTPNGTAGGEYFLRVNVETPTALPSIVVGNHVLLPDTPGQQIPIFVSSDNFDVQGLALFVVLGGGGEFVGQPAGPVITDVDLISGTNFETNNTGHQYLTSFPQIWQTGITTLSGTVVAEGLLATITVDTTGFTTSDGPWTLVLGGDDSIGAPVSSFGGLPIDIIDGQISIGDSNTTIEGRHVFYNDSFFDNATFGNDDDTAIDPTKSALLPGQTATKANYISYTKGINGIMVDVANPEGTIDAADFAFHDMGRNGDTPTAAQAPDSITVRPGEGVGGSDRVVMTWDTSAGIVFDTTWLRVTVLESVGLDAADVFYFGSAPGEGSGGEFAQVDPADELGARNNTHGFGNPATVDDPWDYNKDRFVDPVDQLFARNNGTGFTTRLNLMSAPAAGPFSAELSSGDSDGGPTAAALTGGESGWSTQDTDVLGDSSTGGGSSAAADERIWSEEDEEAVLVGSSANSSSAYSSDMDGALSEDADWLAWDAV